MHVTRLDLRNVRRFEQAELRPGPGLNLIVGDNGAGKTTLLEALHLMAYGRSFRGRVRDGLVREECEALEVFVEWEEAPSQAEPHLRRRRAGLRHSGHSWSGRLDGADVAHLGELCAALAVVSFEPGSHALITGSAEVRRRFVDWGLFHVEPDFLPLWRRYARALKQRNALLKSGAAGAQLDAWDRELAEAGEPLTRRRLAYLERLQARLVRVAEALSPGLEAVGLESQPGWRRHEISLADALLLARDRDRQSGHTGMGPHRADWTVRFARLAGREQLSRGQAKLTALACLLAQAEDYAVLRGEWPVVVLDDLASELDRRHQGRVLAYLQQAQPQVFITATAMPAALEGTPGALFHVEQGRVHPGPVNEAVAAPGSGLSGLV